jgi:hypothetical protein
MVRKADPTLGFYGKSTCNCGRDVFNNGRRIKVREYKQLVNLLWRRKA